MFMCSQRACVIANNIVRNAGLFGIDPVGNCTVTGSYIEGARVQGIHVGLDTGGILRNVIISNKRYQKYRRRFGRGRHFDRRHAWPGNGGVQRQDCQQRRHPRPRHQDRRPRRHRGWRDCCTIDSLSITGNDLPRVQIQSILMVGRGAPGTNFQCFDNRVIGEVPATNRRLGAGSVAWTRTVTPAQGHSQPWL